MTVAEGNVTDVNRTSSGRNTSLGRPQRTMSVRSVKSTSSIMALKRTSISSHHPVVQQAGAIIHRASVSQNNINVPHDVHAQVCK